MGSIQEYYDTDTGSFFFLKTACLRLAGEILPDRSHSEEINEDKFSQLMKNKTVHLMAIFLMVYIGIEVTIGGTIICSFRRLFDNSS